MRASHNALAATMRVIDKHNPRTGYVIEVDYWGYCSVRWHSGDVEVVSRCNLIFPETTPNAIPAV